MDNKSNKEIHITIPKTVAVIMDGNRRYAQEHGLSIKKGHFAGYKKLRELLRWVRNAKIENLIVYAFSTENWKRNPKEVENLIGILSAALTSKSLRYKNLRIHVVGDLSMLSKEIQKQISELEKETKNNTPCTLSIAMSYGGQDEIVAATNKALKQGKKIISKEEFAGLLWAGDIVPDMLIRTGGEKRLSNFLLWQSAYTELFFTETLWPAFSQEEFAQMLIEYSKRKRNFGI